MESLDGAAVTMVYNVGYNNAFIRRLLFSTVLKTEFSQVFVVYRVSCHLYEVVMACLCIYILKREMHMYNPQKNL